MPLGHISLPTTPSTYKPMRDFYLTTLTPLGYTVYEEQEGVFFGLQSNHNPDFWLHCAPPGSAELPLVDRSLTAEENRKILGGRTHLAFTVGGKKAVEGWFRNAIKAGGIPNGEPGERPEYVKGYYAAFVLDPLGNNVEVVHFNPCWLQVMKMVPGIAIAVFGAVAGHFALGYAKAAGWV